MGESEKRERERKRKRRVENSLQSLAEQSLSTLDRPSPTSNDLGEQSHLELGSLADEPGPSVHSSSNRTRRESSDGDGDEEVKDVVVELTKRETRSSANGREGKEGREVGLTYPDEMRTAAARKSSRRRSGILNVLVLSSIALRAVAI